MSREQFLQLIRSERPESLVNRFLSADLVAAFETAHAYDQFKDRVSGEFALTEAVFLVGSGNWGYSLNPDKGFKAFDMNSDIDVAVIAPQLFEETWGLIRDFHRSAWYRLDHGQRQRLRRNGENVYAGFVSPSWIPDRANLHRFNFIRVLNRLSDHAVAYRKVTALYFKNEAELADYYARGFSIAKSKV